MLKLLKKLLRSKFQLLIIFALTVAFAFLWYKPGKIIGGGEDGLSFVRPERTAELFKYGWDDSAMGRPQTISQSRYPYFKVSEKLSILGVSAEFIQITTLWVLYLMGGVGMYFLSLSITKDKLISLIASLFYLTNPYSFANVWHRFISPGFFFFALLPISITYFYVFIKSRNYLYLLLFLLANSLLSYAYSSPAYAVTLWTMLAVMTLYFLLSEKKYIKGRIGISIISLLTLALWIASNWWWLKVSFESTSYYSGMFPGDENINVLRSIGRQYPLSVVLRLSYPSALPKFTNIVTYIIPILSIIGWTRIKDMNIKRIMLFLLLPTLFILNGSNFPTGRLFEFIFRNFYPLQLFRNPYEKFGLTLSIIISILLAYGLVDIVKTKKYIGYLVSTLLFLGLFPLWSGLVFGSLKYNAYVSVPNDYKTINRYLANDYDVFRLVSAPINPGDGVHFNWETPYWGIEPNSYLFDKSTLSRFSRTSGFDNYWKVLRQSYYQGRLGEFARFGNIKYLLFQKQLDSDYINLFDIDKELSFVEHAYQHDDGSKTKICENYQIGTPCDIWEIDFKRINFVKIVTDVNNHGSIKFDIQDNESKHLVFDGSMDDYYTVNGEAPLIVDLRSPTSRYEGFDISKSKYLTIYDSDEINDVSKIGEISVSEGYRIEVVYLKKILESNSLDLFQIDDKYFVPRIYSPDSMTKLTTWNELLYSKVVPQAFIFDKDKNIDIDYEYIVDKAPIISFDKFNPEKYLVQVKDARSPFWLVFSETYHPNWELRDEGGSIIKHFVVNGMSNGYYVEKTGSFDLSLIYRPS